MTAYFDYPTATSSFSFDKARDGMLANVKGTLVSEKSICLGGYSGREVKMSGKTDDGTKFIARVRFYDVNRRIYMVQYIGRKPNDTSAKTTRFLDSFKVVKP